MAFTDTLKTIPDQVLDALEVTQRLVVANASATAASVRALAPAMPTLPFADRLPDPASLTDGAFDFASKVMASQRDFSLKLVAAWMPDAPAKPTPVKADPAK